MIKKTEIMKQFGLATVGSVLLSLGTMAGNSENEKLVLKVNTEESNVVWTGKKVTGKHYGNVDIKEGYLEVKNGKITAGNLKMDMNSITCTDLTDGEWNKKLVDHLRSEDFFSVEKFPTSTFIVTSFSENNDGDEESYNVEGDLTIKGITKKVSFPATFELKDSKLVAQGMAKIDRTQYDIKYGSGSFFKGLGDNMIYNDFEIEFNLVAEISDSDTEVAEQ